MDYTLESTIYHTFTTRQFSTGAPFTLAGTPVVSAYENDSLTQITAGITLGVDHDGVTGLNLLTIVATAANGYEAGKDYNLVITTGTVDSVSVVGEAVWHFSLGRSAAAVDLANATDGLGALKSDTAAILTDTGTTLDTKINTIDTVVDGIQTDLDNGTDGLGALKTLIDTLDTVADAIKAVTDLLPNGGALSDLAAILTDTNELQTDWTNGGRLDLLLDAIPTTPMRGTDSAALASVCTEARLAELDAGNLPTDLANLQGDTDDIQSRLPAALAVGGQMKSHAEVITTDAMDAAALNADAATEIQAAIWAAIVEGTTTFQQSQALQNAAAAGKLSGAATASNKLRNLADTIDRITATVDAAGNRSAITTSYTDL